MDSRKRTFNNLLDRLRKDVDHIVYVDIGVYAEYEHYTSREQLLKAIKVLKNEGYYVTSMKSIISGIGKIQLLTRYPITSEEKKLHYLEWNNERLCHYFRGECIKNIGLGYRMISKKIKEKE